jgi:hypothetical protein
LQVGGWLASFLSLHDAMNKEINSSIKDSLRFILFGFTHTKYQINYIYTIFSTLITIGVELYIVSDKKPWNQNT